MAEDAAGQTSPVNAPDATAAARPPARASADTHPREDPLSEEELAQLHLEWATSKERRMAAWLTAPAAGLLAFILVGVAKLLVQQPPSVSEFLLVDAFWWLGGLVLALYAGVAAYILSRISFRKNQMARHILGQRAEALRQADQGVQNEASPEFAALWRATQTRLDYYHQIATSQSQRSFQYGQFAALAGFGVVVVSAIAAALSASTGAAIAAAITGVAGGGLGGYIGATFMRAQESATVQLRAYFDQPLELSRVLAAERLLDRLDEDHLQQSLQEIIRAIVVSPAATDGSVTNPVASPSA